MNNAEPVGWKITKEQKFFHNLMNLLDDYMEVLIEQLPTPKELKFTVSDGAVSWPSSWPSENILQTTINATEQRSLVATARVCTLYRDFMKENYQMMKSLDWEKFLEYAAEQFGTELEEGKNFLEKIKMIMKIHDLRNDPFLNRVGKIAKQWFIQWQVQDLYGSAEFSL